MMINNQMKEYPPEFFSRIGGCFLSIVAFTLLTLVAIVLLVVLGVYRAVRVTREIIATAPDVAQIEQTPDAATKILDTDGNVVDQFSAVKTENAYVALSQIPEDVREVFLAYLDPDFLYDK